MNLPDPRQIFALDRRAVVRAFDRASSSYDAAAALQERVRNELIGRLDELKITPRSILDLGAGTGHGARALKRRFTSAQVVAVDIAPGMLERRARIDGAGNAPDVGCGSVGVLYAHAGLDRTRLLCPPNPAERATGPGPVPGEAGPGKRAA